MALRKIDLMHSMFGEIPDKKCKDCSNLEVHFYSRRYYKCKCYSTSCSQASDWKVGNIACGLFNKEYNGTPVVRLVVPKKNQCEPMEGQIVLDEFLDMQLPSSVWVQTK